jgi:NAD(P)H-hydrate repair Nnr-like enzyme with NAD(P)H-hydrate epimerase domain
VAPKVSVPVPSGWSADTRKSVMACSGVQVITDFDSYIVSGAEILRRRL